MTAENYLCTFHSIGLNTPHSYIFRTLSTLPA